MKENLALIFDYRLSKTNTPIRKKTNATKKEFLNLLGEFFLPQLPASRFNIQGFRLSNGA